MPEEIQESAPSQAKSAPGYPEPAQDLTQPAHEFF
jgi:hypothetical protein